MKALTFLATAAVATGALATDALADGRNPGSVLVYPIHRSGGDAVAGFWFTILCVTNINTAPQTPISFGGSTNVHFNYVNVTPNPADPFKPLNCVIFDRIEFLTPADTLCVLTSCHNAFGGLGQEGYVFVSAENPNLPPGNAWDHDYLIGSELVLAASGVSYMLDAIPFNALVPAPATPPGIPIRLDGATYEGVPNIHYADFVAAANSRLTMISLAQGSLCNQLYFAVYNDNERPLSATLRFACWFDQPLTAVNPLFANSFLARLPNDPDELDINCDGLGDLETGWFAVDSTGLFYANGQRFAGPGANDGAVLGAITAGPTSANGGRLLAESERKQTDGVLGVP
jgi:hypothetical protein